MATAKKDDSPGKKDAPIPKDWVETAAYFHWEKRGKPHGEPWVDWMEAEKEIVAWLEASGALPPAKKPSPRKK